LAIRLDSEVQFLKGVGPFRSGQLARLGIKAVQDALLHFPARYEDRRNVHKIAELKEGEVQTVRGIILSATETKIKFGRRFFSAVIKDETGILRAVWFNVRSDYLSKKYKPQMNVIATGRVQAGRGDKMLEMPHPEIVMFETDGEEATGGIVPIYPLTEGLNQTVMRKIIKIALDSAPAVPEILPLSLVERLSLPNRDSAMRMLHNPPQETDPNELMTFRTPAHKRLIFEELFMIECAMAILRNKNTESARGIQIDAAKDEVDFIVSRLPFELTGDQSKVLEEIVTDMKTGHPMNRLVQGEVGCGKTVLAAIAISLSAKRGYQSVLMAPTEILAEQHFKTISKLKDALDVKTALLTSSTKDKEKIREMTANGKIDLLIGTHALLQQNVEFKKLGLGVIDEQHRFGVLQRAELIRKGEEDGTRPNTLIMTATPIPRTLAMTVYGDLDVSIIKTMPKGRGATETKIIKPGEMQKARLLIHREAKDGNQVYIVYPLVEESEKVELKAAVRMHEVYQKEVFPDLRVGLVHGRMKQEEKAEAMAKFAAHELDILVSTTVLEVGIDVPNATVMMIEHSERFGLAQLHQLRGRVGRGSKQSYCLLAIEYPMSAVAKERLKVMVESTDGFYIAEKDMELRGTGDVLGTRQSGLPLFRVANLMRDFEILLSARKEAFDLVRANPMLEGPDCSPLLNEINANWKERLAFIDVA
jgi:ATP-dependent DNA helicase RecG